MRILTKPDGVSSREAGHRSAAAAARELLEQLSCIDILISNAGAAYRKSLDETSLADWHGVIESHMTTSFALAKTLAPTMQ